MDMSCYFELYVMEFTILCIVFSIVVVLQERVHYQFQFHTKLRAIDVYLFFVTEYLAIVIDPSIMLFDVFFLIDLKV